jgi:sugar phosphate isomerase/epimerase
VKLSLSQISTANASFEDDLLAYARAGFEGIGLWQFKLSGDWVADRDALHGAGLEATNCVPAVPTILPNPVIAGPDDPDERIEQLCASIGYFANLRPASVVCLTGPVGRFGNAEARRIVVDGLRAAAETAEACGVRLGLEPIHRSEPVFSFVHSIPEAFELLEEAGAPDVGVMVDTYHVWDTETVWDDLERHVDRITGVHVAEHTLEGEEGRALPGEGVGRTRELVQALAAAGWDGWLDVEIFSTPEGFWGLPADEAARRAYAAARTLVPEGAL